MWEEICNFEEGFRPGTVFIRVEREPDDRELTFVKANGERVVMTHIQDCCESVYLADVIGDLEDLVDAEILSAEEVSRDPTAAELGSERGWTDHQTWTFYKFQTTKGAVTLRWVGESNGYYSEHVDIVKRSN